MRLLLVRHGQTPSNVAGLLDTAAPGPGLTELGHRQAAEIPDALRSDPVDGVWVSSLRRTHLTAAPLAADRGLEAIELPGIHEIAAGELELRRDHEAVRVYLETVFSWGLGGLDVRMPGGEDGHEFFERFDSSIARVEASGAGAAVVVSHGAAIRVWVAGRAINVPPSFAAEHDIQNTGVVELDGSSDAGWTLLSWQGTPVGGSDLIDEDAADPTGESIDDALDEE
ncbi:histidine phosphatase family protein [Salinibacterium soli]|uniref:Histidine phosphatase family protein n=1 Tax=Antiquaquibacter soli TaxID=3064523 RepID=A0ABT9BRD7_9MICO|nr:histidine phosphatase family protein [Protaetiibacter sp. WY-16]MDO7881892.1 histidine phosphatase family protein [Protaetiibacter sp. WY-16]